MDKEDVVHVYNGILLSILIYYWVILLSILILKKNKIMPFVATWMQLAIIILSEVSRKRKTNVMGNHSYVESKTWHKWPYLQKRKRLTDIEEKTCACQGGGVWQRDGLRIWV